MLVRLVLAPTSRQVACRVTTGAVSSGCLLSGAVAVLGIVKKPDAEFGCHSDARMHSQIRTGEGTTHLPLKVS